MKHKKSLKDIPIEQNSNEPIRKFDAMSKRQKYICLFLFLMVNALFYSSQKYGPPFYHIETIPFDKSETISNTRKFLLKIGEFNFLNDFLTLDLILIKNHDMPQKKFVDVSLTIKSIKGKRSEILYYQNSKEYQIAFSEEANVSNKIRLYSRGIIDFFRLESDLVMKFHSESPEEEESIPYSGAFIFTYVDASHTIIEALIRLIFFVFGIVWLFYYNNIDINKTTTPLQLNLIRFSIALIVFASNPLYILSYFTESPFLPFLDSIFAIILIFSVLSSTLIILDSTHTKQLNITRKWFFMECLPFAVVGCFFFFDEYVTHYSDDNNMLRLKFLQFIKIGGISICFVLIFVSSLLFEAKNWFDKINMILMILLTMGLTLFFECVESIEPLISSNHAIQIFSLASVSTYVFFLAFIYIPVDPMSANDDYNNDYNNYTDDDENSYDVGDPY